MPLLERLLQAVQPNLQPIFLHGLSAGPVRSFSAAEPSHPPAAESVVCWQARALPQEAQTAGCCSGRHTSRTQQHARRRQALPSAALRRLQKRISQ